ncbi:uncharacterized protein LOC133910553 [Phragmites australis]|uniref:uncharacterized protein LOC133910553 n=1 Tax=Phragmites australis TaxID=29695 RepID=UPI002D783E60|nr:uncharacterized protein LOC133910553 [Phragmites australis]
MISGGGSGLGKKLKKLVAGRGKSKKIMVESDSEDDRLDSDWMPSQDIGEEIFAGNADHNMEDASDQDFEINHQAYVGYRKSWNSTEYTRAKNVYQYAPDNDTSQPHFHTMIQQDAFYGHFLNKKVFEHKWIDWAYVRSQRSMDVLADIFHELGLYELVSLKCNWNATVIRQFYATVEISHEYEKIEWMTGTKKFEASFRDFANAIRTAYDIVYGTIDVNDEVCFAENVWSTFYEPQGVIPRFILGTVTGLKLYSFPHLLLSRFSLQSTPPRLFLIPQASKQREGKQGPSLPASHLLAQSNDPVFGACLRKPNGLGEDDQRKQMMGSGRDHEPERRPGEEEEEAKETEPGDVAGTEASCDYCGSGAAAVYCHADAARLCLPCDRHVHGANGVCSRHARTPLCADCRATGAVFRRAASAAPTGGLFLCSDCDFGRHRDGGEPPLHDRCAVQAYTGCPPAHELAGLLGVPFFEKRAAADSDGWWNIWEEPQVLSLEDLIVPTTPCHGFQPLLTPSSPKNRSIPSEGKINEEILRQLGELAESDGGVQAAAGHEDAEQAGDQFPSWAPPQYITGHGSFGRENSREVATMPTPGYENSSWNNNDYHALNDACKVEIAYEQAPVSSAEACLSSFVPMSEICPSMSNGSSMEGNHQANPGFGVPMQAFPKRGGFDVVPCPDRDSIISRYKEKRKARRFDKQVRYESRKVRADGRLRIKGRFAKANQT